MWVALLEEIYQQLFRIFLIPDSAGGKSLECVEAKKATFLDRTSELVGTE
jgi:hypothetical protein